MKKYNNTKEYIAAFPKEVQRILEEVQATIKKAAPKAAEKISYGIPAFTLNGKNLIYFAGFKKHIGIYPAPVTIDAFKKEFFKYKTGKGSVQFPLDQPMPLSLITKMVRYRIKNLPKDKPTKKSAKKYIKYHKDGSIWAKGKTINDIPEGYWQWFRKDGTIMRSGNFNQGKQTGEWTTYDKKGKVYKVTTMK